MRHEWDFIPDETLEQSRRRIAVDLNRVFANASAEEILTQAFDMYGRRLAMVSSFGAESVVLLDLVAQISGDIPVLFIDTRLLFADTLAYQIEVAAHLGLRDVRRISTDATLVRLADGDDRLRETSPDDCCHLRKTLPLTTALEGFDAWITGRKRFQTKARAEMNIFEVDEAGRMKVNPLANWTPDAIAARFKERGLPRHPLVEKGFASIGCAPCTSPVRPGDDPRSGRWAESGKTECGIHFGANGTVSRTPAEL